MTQTIKSGQRVIGLDCHPDTFTAAILQGPTPAAAVVEKVFNKVPVSQLERWANKHTTADDAIVLEASGNSFNIHRRLSAIDRKAKVLESCHLGKLKEAHANNDKISAVRIGKAYMAGTAKEVWVPDAKTQEQRDLFHAHRKATKRTTATRNSLLSYLSDNGVRLPEGTCLTCMETARTVLKARRQWSDRQWQLIEGLLLALHHADEQRRHWRSMIAQDVLSDPQLMALVRLCGIRDKTAFALAAFVGDIKRFSSPKSLVKYFGLNPAFDDSGENQWHGGIGGHGRKDVRCLLIEGAQAVFDSSTALGKWGRRLMARKGSRNLVVAAIARKMVVAVWYVLNGRSTPIEEVDTSLKIKVGKIVAEIEPHHFEQTNKTKLQWRREAYEHLTAAGKVYHLDYKKTFVPRQVQEAPAA